ncbi:MAG TPA: TlpA disulfide reductase family protein [Thauera sp.]|jgi:thiol-disulfide isomerase/thioredoxin|nr:TlpA disulfide reductase family protein [Thauera sp.]HRA81439.1 TlpA disulfide reductase family protein [Thauera sp.]
MSGVLSRLTTAIALSVVCMGSSAAPESAPKLMSVGELPPPAPALQKALDQAGGKAVIVNFWASWCEPCRDEMPALVELDESEPGLVLITVAVADRAADTQRFQADHLLENLIVIPDPDQIVARAWRARVIPTTYVLDARHQARFHIVGEADWRDPALLAPIRALASAKQNGPKP